MEKKNLPHNKTQAAGKKGRPKFQNSYLINGTEFACITSTNYITYVQALRRVKNLNIKGVLSSKFCLGQPELGKAI